MKRSVSPAEALARMEALCARSEQCRSDIVKKLQNLKINPGDITRIISRLESLRFLDDSRFAKAYCHDKVEFSGWGRHKVAAGLRAKRVDRQLIEDALGEIDMEVYRRVARNAVMSKMRSLGDEAFTREGRLKLMRFGIGRGFETSLVIELIKTLTRRETD